MSAISVETFECSETAHEPQDITDEAAELIQSLGLEGQNAFLVRDDDEKVKTRNPYRLMTAQEIAVYATICPVSEKLEKYDAAPIPIRVLQIAAHAKQVIPGVRLRVWDKSKHEVTDPVLVGGIGTYDWRDEKVYILARWGSELDTFATLAKQAASMIRDRIVAESRKSAAWASEASDGDLLSNHTYAAQLPKLNDSR